MEVVKKIQNIYEGGDASINTSTIQKKYFHSSDLESDYDENDGVDGILHAWKN